MNTTVYVWDKFVRLFHWSLVILFITSYLTGEEETIIHIYSGYAIVALLLARILWGFIGGKHARFNDFVRSPKATIEYINSLKSAEPKRYLGHNPLGGLMVVIMLITLLTITFSGLKLYAVEEGAGPFAQDINITVLQTAQADDDEHHHGYTEEDEASEDFWKEIHEAAVNFMLFLIVLHIAGVIYSSRIHNEKLVKAMITGQKNQG